MSDIINKASNAINVWNDSRSNSIATSNYFSHGTYFEISKADFEVWDANSPEYLHAYLGLVQDTGQTNFSISLFCVDSVTDSKEVETHRIAFLSNLKQSPYMDSSIPNGHIEIHIEQLHTSSDFQKDTSMTPIDALTSSVQWTLHKDKWVAEQENLVQVFEIPFNDLKTLFTKEKAESAIIDIALKEANNVFQIDLILWAYDNKIGVNWYKPMDFTKPAPPFSTPSSFQLYQYALPVPTN